MLAVVQGRNWKGAVPGPLAEPARVSDGLPITRISYRRHCAAGLFPRWWPARWFLEINPT